MSATRNDKYTAEREALLMVLELGLKEWKLGFARGFADRPLIRTVRGGNVGAVMKEIARAKRHFELPEDAPVMSCYEAGRDGFWLHRFLTSKGVTNHIVDSALVPVPYQSGEQDRDLGISKAGNRHVRGIAIEIAWAWLRYQPDSELSRWYLRRFGRGGPRARKIGIVALARKLLIALWRWVEFDELPEGAELKA